MTRQVGKSLIQADLRGLALKGGKIGMENVRITPENSPFYTQIPGILLWHRGHELSCKAFRSIEYPERSIRSSSQEGQ